MQTIQHLFFDCRMARFLWNSLLIAFNVQPPRNTAHLFGPWTRSFAPGLRDQVIVGIAAMCWVLWLNRNDVVFQRTHINSCLQVIFRRTYWIRQWSLLSKEKARGLLKEGCRKLEVVVMQFFGGHALRNQRRIGE